MPGVHLITKVPRVHTGRNSSWVPYWPPRAAIVEMPTPRKVRVVGDGAARPVGARAAGEDRTDGRIKTGVIHNRYTFDGHKLRFCGAASGRDDRCGTPLPQGMKSAGYAHAQYTTR